MSKLEVQSTDKNISESSSLLSKTELGRILQCSPRTVDRLREFGKIPAPIKIGTLVRWQRNVINEWIAQGCPEV